MDTAVLDPLLAMRFQTMGRLIGNTPLLALNLKVNGEPRTIYAKYEPLNLTGSVEMLGFDSVNRVCEMCADPRQ